MSSATTITTWGLVGGISPPAPRGYTIHVRGTMPRRTKVLPGGGRSPHATRSEGDWHGSDVQAHDRMRRSAPDRVDIERGRQRRPQSGAVQLLHGDYPRPADHRVLGLTAPRGRGRGGAEGHAA